MANPVFVPKKGTKELRMCVDYTGLNKACPKELFKPVKQPLRRFGDEKRRAIGKEIARLLKARFIREVLHTRWVDNPVLVPEKGTK